MAPVGCPIDPRYGGEDALRDGPGAFVSRAGDREVYEPWRSDPIERVQVGEGLPGAWGQVALI